MTNIPTDNPLFDGETFKGDLKTHFDALYASGDFQRLIRDVASKHYGLRVDVFKSGFGHEEGSSKPKRGTADITDARQRLIYVLNTFLVKNEKDISPSIIARKFGRNHASINYAIKNISGQLATEAEAGQTALKGDLAVLTLKIIQRVMETSPNGRRVLASNQEAAAPSRPEPQTPAVVVDPANVARKG